MISPRNTAIGMLFQLTPSRRATFFLDAVIAEHENFNSRPHGGRPLSFSYYFIIW